MGASTDSDPPDLGGHGPDPHLHARALHQLHDYGDAEGAVPVGAVGRRRVDSVVAPPRPHQQPRPRGLRRDRAALSGVDAARAQHQLPAAAHQRSDPAHLLADHRLRALPDGDTGEPPPDRPPVPRLRTGDPDRLPARNLWWLSPDQRCRPQGHLQQGRLRERLARHPVLQSRAAEVLRLGARQRHLLLHAVRFPLAGDQSLALEVAGLSRSGRARPVRHAGADAAADAAADPAVPPVPRQPPLRPPGRRPFRCW